MSQTTPAADPGGETLFDRFERLQERLDLIRAHLSLGYALASTDSAAGTDEVIELPRAGVVDIFYAWRDELDELRDLAERLHTEARALKQQSHQAAIVAAQRSLARYAGKLVNLCAAVEGEDEAGTRAGSILAILRAVAEGRLSLPTEDEPQGG